MSDLRQWSVKYRPKSLELFSGNQNTVSLVKEVIKNRSVHAILITGPSGCGKTTLANIVASKFNEGIPGNHVTEKNMSDERGINEIRSLIESARYLPTSKDATKVYILEEAHGITKAAASALLRPLEEPPHSQLLWILVTDRPWVLEPTILGRCKTIPVTNPDVPELTKYLLRIVRKENAFENLEKDAVVRLCKLISKTTACVPRVAVQLLQTASELKTDNFTDLKQFVQSGAAVGDQQMDRTASRCLYYILSKSKMEKIVPPMMKEYASVEAMGLLNRMLFQLHDLLLFATAGKFSYTVKNLLSQFENKPDIEDMTYLLRQLALTRNNLRDTVVNPSMLILPVLLDVAFSIREKN